METAKLKDQLLMIQNKDYRLPKGLDEFEAVELVISSLGSPNGELRDELGYTILVKWLVKENILTGDQLTNILKQAISDDRLYFKIGESGTDSVFQRSFSSLLIALVLFRDNEEQFLSKKDFTEVFNRLAEYCRLEKDFRSHVVGKGWAHAPAHISDALNECVRNRYTDYSQCAVLWESLKTLIENAPHVFDAEEDERIAIPVIAMVEQKKILFTDLLQWIKKIDIYQLDSDLDDAAERYTKLQKKLNFKHLLRCLYMRMKAKSLIGKEEEESLLELEHKFNPHYYNL
ncbi:DUF2785 domain-containing protein [Pullulanibacillus sp. KACC 23026]|uniref:DUF2785 domain-containing protein n=1 Tax=Pullulanibacillus sp. KACC 23026 TaxID=3028315 RepID=UPI0023B04AAD|nr:DUF2785 domain-containing protein [Pullulanibacillus sp. KACC 23026]WEG14524.1 DUF2785 domain-containing protein [Pullulanibacillus sp. KACC 23026]